MPGGDYVFTGDGTDDCDGHGTIVAGIIGAAADSTGGVGFSGVAPDATIIGIRQSSIKFAPAGRSSPGFGDVDTLAMAVRTAADMGATVINVSSIACVSRRSCSDDRALGAALAYASTSRTSLWSRQRETSADSGSAPTKTLRPTRLTPDGQTGTP